MRTILVNCFEGIGDSIYTRPFIKQLVDEGYEVYLKTALPELFSDLGVKFIRPETVKYRAQQRALDSSRVQFEVNPPQVFNRTIYTRYYPIDLKQRGIIGCLERAFGLQVGSTQPKLTLPSTLEPHGLSLPKKLAIIKPPTLRKEFLAPSRNPLPHYVAWCGKVLKSADYHVVSIADCSQDEEWLEQVELDVDLKLHSGELGLFKTLSLIRDASVVVGGPSFIVPTALATGVPLFIIFGGRGLFDNPHKLLDLRMNLAKVGWSLPDKFCRCDKLVHDCDKTISKLDGDFFSFMAKL